LSYEFILTETIGRVGLVRLNRPQALNAISPAMMAEVLTALRAFDADPALGCLVLTGSERAFAAGADIKEMAEASAVEMTLRDDIARWDQVREIKKPLIAAVSGHCLGGGNELAMACDIIVASQTARFGQPEINLGVMPGAGGTQRLARTVGKSLAMEMVLNGRVLGAEEALRAGLVSRVAPVATYLDEALALAAEIAARAPLGVRLGKQAVNNAYETSLAGGLADERRAFYFLFSSEDQKEGMRAFVEKRPPQWKGK